MACACLAENASASFFSLKWECTSEAVSNTKNNSAVKPRILVVTERVCADGFTRISSALTNASAIDLPNEILRKIIGYLAWIEWPRFGSDLSQVKI
jgi:hypothetical protein